MVAATILQNKQYQRLTPETSQARSGGLYCWAIDPSRAPSTPLLLMVSSADGTVAIDSNYRCSRAKAGGRIRSALASRWHARPPRTGSAAQGKPSDARTKQQARRQLELEAESGTPAAALSCDGSEAGQNNPVLHQQLLHRELLRPSRCRCPGRSRISKDADRNPSPGACTWPAGVRAGQACNPCCVRPAGRGRPRHLPTSTSAKPWRKHWPDWAMPTCRRDACRSPPLAPETLWPSVAPCCCMAQQRCRAEDLLLTLAHDHPDSLKRWKPHGC